MSRKEQRESSMKREDLLDYLVVLNYQPVIDLLSEADYKIGRANMEGYLGRVLEQLDKEGPDRVDIIKLADAIRAREKENGNPIDIGRSEQSLKVVPSRLLQLTQLCALTLYGKFFIADFFENEIEGNS